MHPSLPFLGPLLHPLPPSTNSGWRLAAGCWLLLVAAAAAPLPFVCEPRGTAERNRGGV